jgi:putative protease
LVVDIEQLDPQGIGSQLKRLADMIGDSRLRLALPLITRGWEERELREKLRILVGEGYFHWQIANIGGLARLGVESEGPLDFSFDWSLPVLNTASALECLSLGASSLTFSPEDNFLNLSELLRFLGSRAQLIVYQDTPLYLSQTCAQATWTGSCPASAKGEGAYGPETCRHCAPLEICSESNQGFITLRRASRSVTINQHAFCLGPHIPQLITAGAKRLRADFIYRNYEAEDVARIWRLLRKGGSVSGCHDGNFGRAI